jgi:putative membrane-bound dehydrogenase-like protein
MPMMPFNAPASHFLYCASYLSVLLLTVMECQAQAPAGSTTQTVQINQTQFTIPVGMKLELVAEEPLTTWPMLADWDLQGRLLVVESGGVSKPIEDHNKQLLHRVVRLDDENGDGRFDKRTVIAKDLPFTEGVLCVGRDLLITAPPHIYRLIDADQDGVYEDRQIWFDGQTITGCANDLHGPYLGRDGWIYWCKGAFAEQRHELLGGKQLITSAAHIFRRRLSGGAIEPVMTGGMDNPVEVAVTPEGERFFTSTFLHTPGKFPGLRDGLAHAIYGGLYGKDYTKVIAGHIRTGELMPVMVELGAAAPSGLACLHSNQLLPPAMVGDQPELRTLVAAQFNLQKVSSHRLQPAGASFTTINRDLVSADRIDFHPTDILEDSDGSLLVIDTGGWYDLCCPSSRIDQKTAAGGIYRLSRQEPKPLPANSGQQSAPTRTPGVSPNNSSTAELPTPEVLVEQLIDVRPWVRRYAQLQLIELSESADRDPRLSSTVTQALHRGMNDQALPLDQRLTYLWSLGILSDPSSLSLIADLLYTTRQDSLVQAACHILSLHRYQPAREPLENLLGHANLHVRRAAAEALGRLGDAESARLLLAELDSLALEDRHLQHSVNYALIELSAVEVALSELATANNISASDNAATAIADQPSAGRVANLRKRIALLTIDQLQAHDRLTAEMLVDNLLSDDTELRRTVSLILANNPQWAADASYLSTMDALYRQEIPAASPKGSAEDALRTIIAGWRGTSVVQDLLAGWLADVEAKSTTNQNRLIGLISAFAGEELPASWNVPLAEWLSLSDDEPLVELAAALSGLKIGIDDVVSSTMLQRAAKAESPSVRLALLAALPVGSSLDNSHLEETVLQALTEDQPSLAIESLQRIKLSVSSGRELLAGLADQPARQLPIVVEAISRIHEDSLDRELLNLLPTIPAARTLAGEQILNLYRGRSSALQHAAQQTIAELTRPDSDVQEKVDRVLAQLTPGDPIRGLQLFRSSKTACSGCHRLGYVGGEIGPNLTHIGSSRTRSALLEAILFPNARLEQSYQPTKVLTHDGQVYNGLITRHLSPTQFEMQLSADKTVLLSTDDVAEQQPSQVSIMPSGLAELLTPEELSDLMAILESAK